MSVKFLLFERGGGECRFYFYGRSDFSDFGPPLQIACFRTQRFRTQTQTERQRKGFRNAVLYDTKLGLFLSLGIDTTASDG